METLASRGLEKPFFQLCCCVSFWFWREIGFGCTYYYVLGVPYSCGVVLVFLVLAGNGLCVMYVQSSVWWVVLLCQFLVLAGNWQFFCCGGKVLLRPEKKKIQSSVWRVHDHYYDRKKKIQSSVQIIPH